MSEAIFNLNFDQSSDPSIHRSGWQYVYENILSLSSKQSDLHLDMYIDKTFHYPSENSCMLPYTKPWIGFLHHTFDKTFSEHNCVNLFHNTLFIQSLDHCKGIIVLSEYLCKRIKEELQIRNIKVAVFYICHPTETNVKQFSIDNFLGNADKKLLHIGGWLRDIYSFFDLRLSPNYTFSCNAFKKQLYCLKKVAVKGYNMEGYFYPDTFISDISKASVSQDSHSKKKCCISRDESSNNWCRLFERHIRDVCNSVTIVDNLSNEHYDDILSKNIVFLNLVDGSAINTLIECIVRCTPIVIGRIPAVVELLGPRYPLYFDNTKNYFEINKQVDNLLSDQCSIKNAYYYLKRLDKYKFTIKSFKNNFIKIVKSVN